MAIEIWSCDPSFKAENVGNPHLSNLQEISVDFGLSLSRWIGRWSGPLVEKFMKSPEIWICYSTSMGHSIAVSLIASRCVADKRQHKMWTTKKLFNHPCVRRSRCKFPNDTYTHKPLKYDCIYPCLKCPRRFQWSVVCTCFVSLPPF